MINKSAAFTHNVLLIIKDASLRDELSRRLIALGFTVCLSDAIDSAYGFYADSSIEFVLFEVDLPKKAEPDIINLIKKLFNSPEVIILSSHVRSLTGKNNEDIVRFIQKPVSLDELMTMVDKLKCLHGTEKSLGVCDADSLIPYDLFIKTGKNIIGKSRQIKAVVELATTAAQYPDINVLITGESGTGKENVARFIHYASRLCNNVFFAVNSCAISDSLMESEFFGHKKGAFTGALTDKVGYFEACNNGTLFLDEIGDMPCAVQSKILRALEEKAINRVGDTKLLNVNFRVISATNRDIAKMVSDKTFRLDLLHRLNTFHIHIPALRERPEDIAPLLNHFVKNYAQKVNKEIIGISDDAYEELQKHPFEGNIRELKNLSEKAVIFSKNKIIGVRDFKLELQKQKMSFTTRTGEYDLIGNEAEIIRKALRDCNYNQSETASLLRISRDALIRKMRKHEIIIDKMMISIQ